MKKKITIEELFSDDVRLLTVFKNAQIETIDQLTGKTKREILRYKHIGRKRYYKIIERLRNYGLELKGDDPLIVK